MSNLPEVKIGVVFPRESFREQKKSSDEGLYREVWNRQCL